MGADATLVVCHTEYRVYPIVGDASCLYPKGLGYGSHASCRESAGAVARAMRAECYRVTDHFRDLFGSGFVSFCHSDN
jgi:hypothetical protein